MKTTIRFVEYKKVETTKEVSIPEKQMYLWHNGIRRAYSVRPVWTSWNKKHYNKPEEIFELKIVMVNPAANQIEVIALPVSSLPEIVDNTKHPYQRLVDNILNYPDDSQYIRTKEQFEHDFNSVIERLKEGVGLEN